MEDLLVSLKNASVSSSNCTMTEPLSYGVRIVSIFLFAILIIFGIGGNSFIIYVFHSEKKLKVLLVLPLIQHLAIFGIVQSSIGDVIALLSLIHGNHLGKLFYL